MAPAKSPAPSAAKPYAAYVLAIGPCAAAGTAAAATAGPANARTRRTLNIVRRFSRSARARSTGIRAELPGPGLANGGRVSAETRRGRGPARASQTSDRPAGRLDARGRRPLGHGHDGHDHDDEEHGAHDHGDHRVHAEELGPLRLYDLLGPALAPEVAPGIGLLLLLLHVRCRLTWSGRL